MGTQQKDKVILPLPPSNSDDKKFEMEVYARFMRHIRHVPTSRLEIKILSAIQFTADMMDQSDALVAKMLVDMGLLAPRKAYPGDFLEFADRSLQRAAWEAGGPTATVVALRRHWDRIGEDPFGSCLPGEYIVFSETMLT
ncbi:MAG: hypothetical protein H6868_08880 [Rhodospirillales bacterium]|nr:hypothetical protein [Rhodospirillales bacterium]